MTRAPALLSIAVACLVSTAARPQTPQPSARTPADYLANIQRQVARVHAEITPAHHAAFTPSWESLAAYRTPEWFRDAKFGIFIHWGVYAVPAFGSEWYSRDMYDPRSKDFAHHLATYGPQSAFGYKDFIPKFKAEHFDPDAWVTLFAAAGARYIVPVAEHCDGFAMYASDITPWNATAMGPHRDVVGELGHAARAHGLHFGVSSHTAEHWWWYGIGRTYASDVRDQTPLTAMLYAPASPRSLPDPDGKTNDIDQPDPNHLEAWLPPNQAWLDNWLARSTEVVDKYHPEFVYFDWWSGQPAYQQALREFAAYFYNRSAQTGVHPVLTYKDESMPANTATLDIERGKLDTMRLLPWQTDTSVSIESWGYVEHDRYRTAKSLVHQLLDTVAKNGNLLLNLGPRADGTIPHEARSILLEMGGWLHVNGEAIYGSRPFLVFGEGPTTSPINPTKMHSDEQTYTPQDVRFTTSADGSVLYAAVLGQPPGHQLILRTLFNGNPYLPSKVCSVKLLGSPAPVAFLQKPDGMYVETSPAVPWNEIASVFRIDTHC